MPLYRPAFWPMCDTVTKAMGGNRSGIWTGILMKRTENVGSRSLISRGNLSGVHSLSWPTVEFLCVSSIAQTAMRLLYLYPLGIARFGYICISQCTAMQH